MSSNTPPELKEIVKKISLIPETSKEIYEKRYENYVFFLKEYSLLPEQSTPNIVLAYFYILSLAYSPSSLRTILSMIKTCLLDKCNLKLDIEKIEFFIKKKESKFLTKQSEVFSHDEILFFLYNAPDEDENGRNLAIKLSSLISIYGALRGCELASLTFDSIKREMNGLRISMVPAKKKKNGEIEEFLCLSSLKQEEDILFYFDTYVSQFALQDRNGRFWRYLSREKRAKKPIGKNTISEFPKYIATFLKEKLTSFNKDPNKFTGHCWRRTAATWAAESGISLINLKRLGRWESDTVAQNYIANSKKQKRINAVALPNAKKKKENAEVKETVSNNNGSSISFPVNATPFQISGTFQNCNFYFFEKKNSQ